MSLRPPISTLTDSLFTYTTLFRSKGQAPRIHDLADPINTIVACGGRQASIQAGVIHQDIRGANSEPGSNASLSHAKRASIVAAHMAQQNEGNVGHPVTEPASTMTSKVCHQNVVRSEERRVGKEVVSTCRTWWA